MTSLDIQSALGRDIENEMIFGGYKLYWALK